MGFCSEIDGRVKAPMEELRNQSRISDVAKRLVAQGRDPESLEDVSKKEATPPVADQNDGDNEVTGVTVSDGLPVGDTVGLISGVGVSGGVGVKTGVAVGAGVGSTFKS